MKDLIKNIIILILLIAVSLATIYGFSLLCCEKTGCSEDCKSFSILGFSCSYVGCDSCGTCSMGSFTVSCDGFTNCLDCKAGCFSLDFYACDDNNSQDTNTGASTQNSSTPSTDNNDTPNEPSGTSRQFEASDVVAEISQLSAEGAENNDISSVSGSASFAGKAQYVYIDCTIKVVWTYELMEDDGQYHQKTLALVFELDRLGNAELQTAVDTSIVGYAYKLISSECEVISGTISVK